LVVRIFEAEVAWPCWLKVVGPKYVDGVIAVFDIAIDPVEVIGFGEQVRPVPAEIDVMVPVVGVAHFIPVVWVESAVKTCPSGPTGNLVDVVEKVGRSPLVVNKFDAEVAWPCWLKVVGPK
jgi:hypothetical protein